jgi:hypothetical protein
MTTGWMIGYHPPRSQCYYHWVDASAGELLNPDDIIHPVVSVTIRDIDPVIVTLTTGWMISSGSNSSPAEVSIQ